MIDETGTKGERTRGEIVQAAHRLFMKNGYHATSMRQIAQEAGLVVGGLYNHFASKEEIFVAVLLAHHPINEILPALSEAATISSGLHMEDFIREAARRMVASFKDRPDFLNLMFIEAVEFGGRHVPGLFEKVFPQVVVFAQRFLTGSQELRPIPVPVLVRAFVGLFFSYVITQIMLGENLPAEFRQDDTFDLFVDMFLHGILVDNPSPAA